MARKKPSIRLKELNRIERYIKKQEKKGLMWSAEFKESIKSKSTKALKELTWRKLLRESVGISPSTGEIISGFDVRREQRRMAGKKAWQKFKAKRKYGERVYQGQIILNRLYEIVDQYIETKLGAFYLGQIITRELQEFRDRFLIALAELDDRIVEEATTLAFYDSHDRDKLNYQYNKVINMIRGAMPTEAEAKETGEAMDSVEDAEEEIYE